MIDIQTSSFVYVSRHKADVARRQSRRNPPMRSPVRLGSLAIGDRFTIVPLPRQSVASIVQLHPDVVIFQRVKPIRSEMTGEVTVYGINSRLRYNPDHESRHLMPADTPVYPAL